MRILILLCCFFVFCPLAAAAQSLSAPVQAQAHADPLLSKEARSAQSVPTKWHKMTIRDTPGPQFINVIAIPRGSRAPKYAKEWIREHALYSFRELARESDNTRTFHYGVTNSGSLDTRTVKLPWKASQYSNLKGKQLNVISKQVLAGFNTPPQTHLVIWAVGVQEGGAAGIATLPSGVISQTPEGLSLKYMLSRSPGIALMYVGSQPLSAPAWRSTLSHEMLHLLGAVEPGQPRATDGWHCWQEWDIMCYADGTSASGSSPCIPGGRMTSRQMSTCVGRARRSPTCKILPRLWKNDPLEARQHIDCGQDDYFSPTASLPFTHRYLTVHLQGKMPPRCTRIDQNNASCMVSVEPPNTADSPWLCRPRDCAGSSSPFVPRSVFDPLPNQSDVLSKQR